MLVNMHEAKTNLSKLVARAEAGEEIVIGRSGRPVAKLVPVEGVEGQPGRPLGLAQGQIRIHGDFDAPLPEDIAAAFRGEGRLFPE